MQQPIYIHQRLGLSPGNIIITGITPQEWGSQLVVTCVYRYPPDEKPFTLIFHDCRSMDWYIQKSEAQMQHHQSAQLLTHDLGLPDYDRTARLATTLFEVVIAYRKLKIEKFW